MRVAIRSGVILVIVIIVSAKKYLTATSPSQTLLAEQSSESSTTHNIAKLEDGLAEPHDLKSKLIRVRNAETSSYVTQLSLETKDLMLGCLKNQRELSEISSAKEFSSLTEFVAKAMVREPIETTFLYRNLHIVDRDGRNLRLHVAPKKTADGMLKPSARLFSTDDENLPVALPLPRELQGLDLDKTIELFKSYGQLTFDELSEAQKWDDRLGANILRRNGRVEKLEIYFNGGALVCAKNADQSNISCRCL